MAGGCPGQRVPILLGGCRSHPARASGPISRIDRESAARRERLRGLGQSGHAELTGGASPTRGFRVAKPLNVGGFILTINGDRAVFTSQGGGAGHGSPAMQMRGAGEETPWGAGIDISRPSCRAQGVTTTIDGM